jgi:hypothetical protein
MLNTPPEPRAPRRRGRQVRLDDVVDVAEVARLRAVAEDARLLSGQRRGDELRDHGRVLRLRILARAEHVEVAQADGLEAVGARVDLHRDLAGQLASRRRARSARAHGLDLGQRGSSPYAADDAA